MLCNITYTSMFELYPLSLHDALPISNIITPTSGVLMAVLAVGGVQWIRWIRFAFPLLLMWIVVGVIAITVAVAVGFGPYYILKELTWSSFLYVYQFIDDKLLTICI